MQTSDPLFAWNAGYKKPVDTLLEISPSERRFRMVGQESDWIGPSPQSVGYTSASVKPEWISSRISPRGGTLPV